MHDAPNARVIQLFTHADADSTDAVEPRVYFHDAALRLSELTQADRFASQLLVLSACKTGVGQNQRGEGVFSLDRGFAALGIPSTITTLWSVEDQPTYELTKLFYLSLIHIKMCIRDRDIELSAQCPSRIYIWEKVEKGNETLDDTCLLYTSRCV